MPIFGKSRVEKAIEERDMLLHSIQSDLSQVRVQPPQREAKLIGKVRDRLFNTSKTTLLHLDKLEEIKAVICTIPKEYEEAKYYFLDAVWYVSYLTKSLARSEGVSTGTGYLPYVTGSELSNYLNEQGLLYMNAKKYQDAIPEFTSGLETARLIKNAYLIGLLLRNLAGCQYAIGKITDAKKSLQEAVVVLNERIADPEYPEKTKEQLQIMLTEYSGLISEM